MSTTAEYNPNIIAYAASRNMSVEECLKADEKQYPGGKMTGFITWMSDQMVAFDKQAGRKYTVQNPAVYNPNEYFYIRNTEAFHKWIQDTHIKK